MVRENSGVYALINRMNGIAGSGRVVGFDSLPRHMKTLLKKKISVYGDRFYVELRRDGKYYKLYNVYPKELYGYRTIEEERGIPTESIQEAIESFERICGVKLTEELKQYIL